MGVLVWVVRALGLLLILRFVLRALFGPGRQVRGGPRPHGGPGMERAGGELVRDPNCGTYVPKANAIVAGSGPGARYFCSTKCRDTFLKQ